MKADIAAHVRGARAARRRIERVMECDPERVIEAFRRGILYSYRPAPKRKADRPGVAYIRIEANV